MIRPERVAGMRCGHARDIVLGAFRRRRFLLLTGGALTWRIVSASEVLKNPKWAGRIDENRIGFVVTRLAAGPE